MADTQLTQSGEQVQADLNLTENLQEEFTDSTYDVGDLVIHDSKLWRCHTAITSASSIWTGSTNWTEIKLSDLFTSSERTKLASIAAGAEVNVIETVKVNDTALIPSNKTVNIDISGKADKSVPSTAGNLAKLDVAGNLADSGILYTNVTTHSEISYITTAPTAANTSGLIKIVVLSSEPITKYDGYIYIITGTTSQNSSPGGSND